MAERDAGGPPPDALSTEEADRLSERFRPSWEPDPEADPLTRPRAPVAPKPIPRPAVPVLKPGPATASPGPDALVSASKRLPTLVGIQPTIPVGPRAPDDLDWEAPTNRMPAVVTEPAVRPAPAPEALPEPEMPLSVEVEELSGSGLHETLEAADVQSVHPAEVEELPPPSKPSAPSGIGEKYVPKEQGAPAIVLNEDVKAAEEQARLALEARHRSRRAPTIARMRIAEIPLPPPPEEELTFPAPKRRTGLWLALGSMLIVLVGVGVLLTTKASEPPTSATKQATAVAENTTPPGVPAPPSVPAPAVEPAQVATAAAVESAHLAEPTASAAEPSAAASVPAQPAVAREPAAAAPEPTTKPAAARPKASKPPAPATTTKPAPARTTSKPSPKGVIVRDTPF